MVLKAVIKEMEIQMALVEEAKMAKEVKHIMVGLGSIRRLRMLAMYTAGE